MTSRSLGFSEATVWTWNGDAQAALKQLEVEVYVVLVLAGGNMELVSAVGP
jgi:hypothetical protein